NVPIAAGALLVLLTTIVGGVALSNAASDASATGDDAYAKTLALSRARIAAYDARSNESLTLIARGSGDAFDKAYKDAAAVVDDQLGKASGTTDGLQDLWSAYKDVHGEVRKADKNGDWDSAVALAVGSEENKSDSVDKFSAFDTSSAAQLQTTSEAVSDELTDARDVPPPLGRHRP